VQRRRNPHPSPATAGIIAVVALILCYAAGCTVEAKPIGVDRISLDVSGLALHIGDTAQLRASVLPADAPSGIQWSSDSDAATVTQAGLVTAVSAGVATVTASSSDGARRAGCKVTVLAAGAGGVISITAE
jgi:uncharacterized protein YjdB